MRRSPKAKPRNANSTPATMTTGPATEIATRRAVLGCRCFVAASGLDQATSVVPMATQLTDNAPGPPEDVW